MYDRIKKSLFRININQLSQTLTFLLTNFFKLSYYLYFQNNFDIKVYWDDGR